MTGNYKDVTEEDKEFFDKISKLDPLFFSRGYNAEEINKILKKNGIIGNIIFVKKLKDSYKLTRGNLGKKEFKEMCEKAGVKEGSLCKTIFTKNL